MTQESKLNKVTGKLATIKSIAKPVGIGLAVFGIPIVAGIVYGVVRTALDGEEEAPQQ